jgi:hypothetical protein
MQRSMTINCLRPCWRKLLVSIALFAGVFLSGCSTTAKARLAKFEQGVETVIADIKTIDAAAANVAPVIAAVAEVVAPGSTAAADIKQASVILTKTKGAVQSFHIAFPEVKSDSTAQAVVSSLQATSDVSAQIAPQLTQIAEAAAPGSTAAVDLKKATTKITTVNGIIQTLSVTVPAGN